MSLPYSYIGSWTYTNPATSVAVNIPMTAKPDWVFVKDTTNWGAQTTAANPIYAEWFSSMAQGSYLALGQPSSTGTGVTTYASAGTSGGFTFINQINPPTFTKVAITSVNGTTFVVATGNTAGLAVGDTVRLINVVGGQQISGSTLYQITAITANTNITLGFAASAASAGLTVANATTGFYQKVYPKQFVPNTLPVAYVTQASTAVVYFFRQHPYSIGELVDFQIPTPYGMTQLSNLTKKAGSGPFTSNPAGAARVIATTNSATVSSITIDVDTTGFTAFQFPTSALFAGGASPAVCIPAGSGVVPLITSTGTGIITGSATLPASPPGTNLVDAFDNKSQYIMNLGTSVVGVASANMVVVAFKADFVNGVSNA